MSAIPLLQYIKENSREENVQLLPSLIRYAKSVTIFEAEKHSDLPVIPRDISYQDFISSLVTELVLRKSHNALVSGYKVAIEDNNVTTACINFDGNFLPTSLNDANWHRIFVLVGQEKFLNLLINYKGFLCRDDGGDRLQIFGDIASHFKPASNATSVASKWIYKFDVLYQSRNIRYRKYEIIRTDLQTMLAEVVSCCTPNVKTAKRTITKRFRAIKSVLSRIAANDKKCRYDIIFDKFLSTAVNSSTNVTENSTAFDRVVEVVLIIMGKLLPAEAWGGPENRKILKDRIVDFLRLGVGERLHIEDILKGVKLQKFSWLGTGERVSSTQDFRIRTTLLEGYIKWIIGYLVKNIIRTFWYVTESSNSDRLRLFYFTHSVWNEMSGNWLKKYAKANLTKVESSNSKEKFTHGKIKLIPKRASFRVICVPLKQSLHSFNNKVSESLRQKEKWDYLLYQRNILSPIRQVLRLKLKNLRETTKGYDSSVTSTDEIAERVLAFRSKLLSKSSTMPILYMMKFDMKECYDRLDQRALNQALAGLFKGEDDNTAYYVREYATLDEQLKLKKSRNAIETQVHNFRILSEGGTTTGPSRTKADRVKTAKVTKGNILKVCRSQIEDATCLIKNKENQYDLYKRKRGVFQGFNLSGIFCEILYSSIVANEFKFLWGSTSDVLLVRLVDDFLFVTTDPEAFEKVQEKVSSGELQKYGAYVNNDKTVLINGKESTQSKLSFVGLDINTTSLEVKKDSSQFGRPAFKFRSFKALFTHLKQYYCTNLSDFLLDSSSNLLETVIVNVRTVLMLMFEAIKASFVSMCKSDTFHCYRFIKFLNNIFEITLDRFIKVNGSSEGMEELLACIKVTATRALAFMKDKQEIIEWIYTLEL